MRGTAILLFPRHVPIIAASADVHSELSIEIVLGTLVYENLRIKLFKL